MQNVPSSACATEALNDKRALLSAGLEYRLHKIPINQVVDISNGVITSPEILIQALHPELSPSIGRHISAPLLCGSHPGNGHSGEGRNEGLARLMRNKASQLPITKVIAGVLECNFMVIKESSRITRDSPIG